METIQTYEQDKSAMGRIQVWRDGIEYAFSHPLTGAGFEGWRYVSFRDWHSVYVEALAEHGVVGFSLWASLLFGTMLSLTRLAARTNGIAGLEWVQNYALMLRASLVAYAVGGVFLGITYWDLMYQLVFIGMLTKRFALEELAATAEKRGGGRLPEASSALHQGERSGFALMDDAAGQPPGVQARGVGR
jgi:O-antigen ligase